MITKTLVDAITFEIIGAAMEVQKQMGRGLLESIYHECMKIELANRKINFQTEMKIPVNYKDHPINLNFRCDLYVENSIVVELKAVNEITPLHTAQMMTYMKLLNCPKGVLINFNSPTIFKDGQKTFVNEIYRNLPA